MAPEKRQLVCIFNYSCKVTIGVIEIMWDLLKTHVSFSRLSQIGMSLICDIILFIFNYIFTFAHFQMRFKRVAFG